MSRTTPQRTLTGQLADFAVRLPPASIPSATLVSAADALIDAVACGLRGISLAPAQAVKRALAVPGAALGIYPCFDGSRVPLAGHAAFINATAVHSLELDDTDAVGLTHPGAVVIPAALAIVTHQRATGRDLLEAVTVGYDVACRLARWVNPEHRVRGYHTTATITTLGAVAAVARLRGMDPAVCASAMAIALSYAGGSFEFASDGTNLKRAHAGKAASTAIQACDLASAGVEGPATALEGVHGFYRTSVCEQFRSLSLDDLGDVFLIEQVGTKRHACCRFCHTAIDAAIDLHARGVPIERSSAVEVTVSSLCHEQTALTAPRNELQRQLSTPYGVALGLLTGTTRLADYQGPANRQALHFASTIRMIVDHTIEPRDRRATVRVTADGVVYEQSLDAPRGEPATPLTPSERLGKFVELTADLPIVTNTQELYENLQHVEHEADARIVMEQLFEELPPCSDSTKERHA